MNKNRKRRKAEHSWAYCFSAAVVLGLAHANELRRLRLKGRLGSDAAPADIKKKREIRTPPLADG